MAMLINSALRDPPFRRGTHNSSRIAGDSSSIGSSSFPSFAVRDIRINQVYFQHLLLQQVTTTFFTSSTKFHHITNYFTSLRYFATTGRYHLIFIRSDFANSRIRGCRINPRSSIDPRSSIESDVFSLRKCTTANSTPCLLSAFCVPNMEAIVLGVHVLGLVVSSTFSSRNSNQLFFSSG